MLRGLRRRFTLTALVDDLGNAAAQRHAAIHAGTYRWLLFGSAALAIVGASLLLLSGDHRAGFLPFNALATPAPDWLLANLTEFGNTAVLVAMGATAARGRPQFLLALVMAVLIGAVLINGLKGYFAIPRPPAVLDGESFRLVGDAYRRGSFPSGHTFATFTVAAVALGFLRAAPLRLAVLIGATLIASSRVWVGVHWPLDLIGGAVGGLLTGALALHLSQRWQGGFRPLVHLSMLWLVLISNLVLLREGTNYALADPLMRLVTVACTASVAWQYLLGRRT